MRTIGFPAFIALAVVACGNAPLILADTGADTDSTDTAPDLSDDVGVDTLVDAGPDGTPPVCQEDIYGITSSDRAIAVNRDTDLSGLSACTDAPDYFSFTPKSGAASIAIDVTTSGLVRLTVDGQTVSNNSYVANRTAGDPTPLEVVVTGLEDSVYAIEFRSDLDVVVPDCLDTPEEPNDSADTGFEVGGESWSLETRICSNDDDWYLFDVPAGGQLDVAVAFTHREGDIDTALYKLPNLDAPVAESNGAENGERVSIGPIASGARYAFHVYGWEGATNDYEIISSLTVEEDGFPATISGVVRYEDRVFSSTGFTGELVPTPVDGGVVEVVREDGSVVGTGRTNERGEFEVEYFAQEGEVYRVRAISVGTYDGFRVEVRDRTGASALYAVESDEFPADFTISNVELLAAADDGIGGGLNIVDNTIDAFQFVADYSDERSPTLTYFWQSGQAYPCGSCYSGNAISLGGQLEDPDEYDDDIILHEFSHYMVEHYSADSSRGGSHRDRLVDPYLAYGEGLAYFLSSAIRDDPTMTDNFLGDARFIDYEAITLGGEDLEDFYGTTNGRPDGNQREELPAGIIWDVWDGPSADEPWDTIALGGRTIELIFDYFHDGMPVDVGVRGIEITDFMNAVACELDTPSELQPLIDDRDYPFDAEEEASCSFKGSQAVFEAHNHQGDVVLNGAVAGLAFELSVDDGEGVQKFSTYCTSEPCLIATEVGQSSLVLARTVVDERPVAVSWVGRSALARLLGGTLTSVDGHAVRAYPTR